VTADRVSDGDTRVAFSPGGTKLRIRLLGIDDPEIARGKEPGQPFGEEAHGYLAHPIGGKTVRVDAYGPDGHRCVLAVIWDGQVNVNPLLLAMGYVEVYRGATCQAYCRELEQAKARWDRVGMWSQVSHEGPAAFRSRLRRPGSDPPHGLEGDWRSLIG